MFYRTLVGYPEDGLHMQAPWVKIWILSCYEVFTISIDGGSDITTGVSVTTPECPMSYTPETEECPENLDHSFGYSGVSVDILECPLNYRLETQE